MYIVIEIQTAANGLVSTIVTQHSDANDAYAQFHSILAAAAVSELPQHAAVILYNNGNMVRSEHYTHEIATEE